MKKKATLIILGVVVLVIVVVMISFNAMMSYAIDSQARSTVAAGIKWTTSTEGEDDLSAQEELPLMTFENLYVRDDYALPSDDLALYYASYRGMVAYCKAHPEMLESDEIAIWQADGKQFYVAQGLIKNDPGLSAWLTQDGDPTGDTIVIIYVNVTPLLDLTRMINRALLVVLVFAIALSVFTGIRMGVMIENAEEKTKNFFQNTSHELKTPIMSIQGYAEGIVLGVAPDDKQAAQVILDESERMANLVEEILCLAQLDSGYAAARFEETDLRDLLTDCLERQEYAAQRKGVSFCCAPCDAPITVLCVRKHLRMAIGNLISNGIRYARTTLSIDLLVHGRHVDLTISDDGGGIAPEDLPHIFERFYAGKSGNTGIGLALSHSVVSQHKGKLFVLNAPSGARFRLTLPLC
ncbi:MAG: HAMP domain-containing sensor histidine kinase [Clostridia bacterium]